MTTSEVSNLWVISLWHMANSVYSLGVHANFSVWTCWIHSSVGTCRVDVIIWTQASIWLSYTIWYQPCQYTRKLTRGPVHILAYLIGNTWALPTALSLAVLTLSTLWLPTSLLPLLFVWWCMRILPPPLGTRGSRCFLWPFAWSRLSTKQSSLLSSKKSLVLYVRDCIWPQLTSWWLEP